MIDRTTDVREIPALEHDEAMRVAAVECERLLQVADELRDDDWSQQTDCPDWDVRAMLGHVLGMLELQADPAKRMRQLRTATEEAAQSGGVRIDALTALQVREHASLSPDALVRALHETVPRGLAARRAMTSEQRAAAYDAQLPHGEPVWTVGYLFDIIHTRDPWIHRVDVCRAIGRAMTLTAEHDGRIVADVVAEWARRHGQAFRLTLHGPAGGRYESGSGSAHLELDAVEFCRVLSGRSPGTGLLATRVPF